MQLLISRTARAADVIPGDYVLNPDSEGWWLVDQVSRNREHLVEIAVYPPTRTEGHRIIMRSSADHLVAVRLDPETIDHLAGKVADAVGPEYRTWCAELDMVVETDGSLAPQTMRDRPGPVIDPGYVSVPGCGECGGLIDADTHRCAECGTLHGDWPEQVTAVERPGEPGVWRCPITGRLADTCACGPLHLVPFAGETPADPSV